ncbi:hydroxysteroid dehydrogenase [Taterapox virus]|uniref:Hydroxysteroid dehydrogenase n=1 Tax=Taterapox virus TaxID=28871 RepID=Q0NP40_9POXV|nr:hydroxysteroid degydrogenase [Taterapox virus]ABD97737.1 hydroxysteroid dehydrogenase [Taterapox virus]
MAVCGYWCAGFLGRYIVKLLISADDVQEIRVIDVVEYPQPLTSKVKVINYIQCDINDFDKVKEELDGANLIIHTVARMYLENTPIMKS